jgi:hypothetical protein
LATGEIVAPHTISVWTKEGDRKNQIRTMWKMFQHLKIQLAANFNGLGGSNVWTSIIMQYGSTF